MNSIVGELQMRALDPNIAVSDLLRMAKVVAVKLKLSEFKLWIDSELGGYEELEVPTYRVVYGQMKAHNPYQGLISVTFHDDSLAETCTTRKLHQKISEIEILSKTSESSVTIPISGEQQVLLRNYFRTNFEFKLIFPSTILGGIVDCVRSVLLDWSLKLEENGIEGEGMTFSKEDKARAQNPAVTYQINKIENFTGNMGSVSDHSEVHASSQIGIDIAGLKSLILELSTHRPQFALGNHEDLSMQENLAELSKELNNPSPAPSKIGSLLGGLKSILQSAASSLLVRGALYELDKYKDLIHRF